MSWFPRKVRLTPHSQTSPSPLWECQLGCARHLRVRRPLQTATPTFARVGAASDGPRPRSRARSYIKLQHTRGHVHLEEIKPLCYEAICVGLKLYNTPLAPITEEDSGRLGPSRAPYSDACTQEPVTPYSAQGLAPHPRDPEGERPRLIHLPHPPSRPGWGAAPHPHLRSRPGRS